MEKSLKDISILMISTDDGLLSDKVNDVRTRHSQYALSIKALYIIVLGGETQTVTQISDHLTVYSTGTKGYKGYKTGLKLAKKVCLERQIDLIDTQDPHATGLIGLKMKKQYNLPLEIHFHGDFWNNSEWLKESWKNRIFNYWQKKVVPEADMIRVTSYGLADKLKESGVDSEKIVVINTPVDIKLFSAVSNRPVEPKQLLFVGRLVEAKNLFFTLEVIAALHKIRSDFEFIIIGEGKLRAALIRKAKELNLKNRVKFLGAKKSKDLSLFYQQATVLLLLSTNESFGKVIVEAGVAGLPTIASRTIGASSIIIDNKTGLLVGINDKNETVKAVTLLLDNSEVAKQLGRSARVDYFERFDRVRTITQIFDVWQKIVNSKRA